LFKELKTGMDPAAETDDASLSVSASLSLPDPEMRRLYILNFKIRCNEIRKQHTFLLEDTSMASRISSKSQLKRLYQAPWNAHFEDRRPMTHRPTRFFN
jgi:hypothetical protein